MSAMPEEMDLICGGTQYEADAAAEAAAASSENAQLAYRYRGADFAVIWQTSVPKDDEAALGYFHTLMGFGKGFRPVYCERITRDPNGDNEDVFMLDEIFDPEARETKPFDL